MLHCQLHSSYLEQYAKQQYTTTYMYMLYSTWQYMQKKHRQAVEFTVG